HLTVVSIMPVHACAANAMGHISLQDRDDDEDDDDGPVNVAPVITGQHLITAREDEPFTLSVDQLTVLDPDNGPEPITLVVLDGDRYTADGLTITPEENFFGLLQVNVRVSDGQDLSPPFVVVVDVASVNDRPMISGQHADPFQLAASQSLTLTLSHLQVADP